ncbi:MAG: hypothetical protein FJZ87_07510 [Chloroflexi bacterium]|nr:hypothetical protein [Chloroflexota bacterium]
MQANPTNRTLSPLWLNDWRAKVKTLAGNIFSPPYLPGKFIIFFLITNVTHMAIIFMNQPLNYWTNKAAEKGIAYNGSPMDFRPVDWVIFGAIYLALALFCLTVFNYRWSLIGWLTAEVIHLDGIQSWLTDCSFGRWSPTLGKFCGSFDEKWFWVICGLIFGLFIASSLHPSSFSFQNKRVEKGLSRVSVLAPAIWVVFLIGGVVSSAQKPGTYGWVPVDVKHKPGPLSEARVAYDTKNNELVLFGGVSGYLGNRWDYKSDTWVWDGKRWLNVYPSIFPSGRVNHAMAYDENRGMVVMFGGYNDNGALDDTWEWDGFTWANKCTCNHPSARYGHEMFYDPLRKKVVLYGGYDGKTEYNDVWEWDGEGCKWNKLETGGDIPIANYFTVAYDPERQSMLAYLNQLSASPGGTWTIKGDTWKKLPATNIPGNRSRTTMVYDPNHKTFALFGGELHGLNVNDTWLFDGKNWSQFKTRIQPSIRADMVMWYDQIRKHIILYGGQNGDARLSDMWEFVFPGKQ